MASVGSKPPSHPQRSHVAILDGFCLAWPSCHPRSLISSQSPFALRQGFVLGDPFTIHVFVSSESHTSTILVNYFYFLLSSQWVAAATTERRITFVTHNLKSSPLFIGSDHFDIKSNTSYNINVKPSARQHSSQWVGAVTTKRTSRSSEGLQKQTFPANTIGHDPLNFTASLCSTCNHHGSRRLQLDMCIGLTALPTAQLSTGDMLAGTLTFDDQFWLAQDACNKTSVLNGLVMHRYFERWKGFSGA